jgi:hypothetical protein
LKQALAVGAAFAVSSSWLLGWSVVVHVTDDHHHAQASDHSLEAGLEMAFHGHAHSEQTPAHGHPFIGGMAAPLPGKLLLMVEAASAVPHGLVIAEPTGRRLLSQAGPTHDPPPRPVAVSILRI